MDLRSGRKLRTSAARPPRRRRGRTQASPPAASTTRTNTAAEASTTTTGPVETPTAPIASGAEDRSSSSNAPDTTVTATAATAGLMLTTKEVSGLSNSALITAITHRAGVDLSSDEEIGAVPGQTTVEAAPSSQTSLFLQPNPLFQPPQSFSPSAEQLLREESNHLARLEDSPYGRQASGEPPPSDDGSSSSSSSEGSDRGRRGGRGIRRRRTLSPDMPGAVGNSENWLGPYGLRILLSIIIILLIFIAFLWHSLWGKRNWVDPSAFDAHDLEIPAGWPQNVGLYWKPAFPEYELHPSIFWDPLEQPPACKCEDVDTQIYTYASAQESPVKLYPHTVRPIDDTLPFTDSTASPELHPHTGRPITAQLRESIVPEVPLETPSPLDENRIGPQPARYLPNGSSCPRLLCPPCPPRIHEAHPTATVTVVAKGGEAVRDRCPEVHCPIVRAVQKERLSAKQCEGMFPWYSLTDQHLLWLSERTGWGYSLNDSVIAEFNSVFGTRLGFAELMQAWLASDFWSAAPRGMNATERRQRGGLVGWLKDKYENFTTRSLTEQEKRRMGMRTYEERRCNESVECVWKVREGILGGMARVEMHRRREEDLARKGDLMKPKGGDGKAFKRWEEKMDRENPEQKEGMEKEERRIYYVEQLEKQGLGSVAKLLGLKTEVEGEGEESED